MVTNVWLGAIKQAVEALRVRGIYPITPPHIIKEIHREDTTFYGTVAGRAIGEAILGDPKLRAMALRGDIDKSQHGRDPYWYKVLIRARKSKAMRAKPAVPSVASVPATVPVRPTPALNPSIPWNERRILENMQRDRSNIEKRLSVAKPGEQVSLRVRLDALNRAIEARKDSLIEQCFRILNGKTVTIPLSRLVG